MKDKIVSKFGGTSMADAQAMLRSASIAKKQSSNLVVVSATHGTTNKLIELASVAEFGEWKNCETIIDEITEKHLAIAKDLDVSQEVKFEIERLIRELESLIKGINLLKECSLRAMDNVLSFGERLSSLLFTVAMERIFEKNITLIDARKILITDNNFSKATPNLEKIMAAVKVHLADDESTYVTQGFIGRNEEGLTTTLGRGGSDYSAALFAEAMEASVLEIWTDVAGIATTDPRICSDAKSISEITFKEATELAAFGAKILHPITLTPAMRGRIPVFVGSSYESEKKGTWVRNQADETPIVRAMAKRDGQSLLTISTPKMLHTHGFLFNIFKIFNDNKISIDAITTSEISISLTVDDATLLNKNFFHDLAEIAEVKIEEGLSLISLIGNNIIHITGLRKEIFTALDDINVRMICLGASKHNFCFLVDEVRSNEAINRLHKRFIN